MKKAVLGAVGVALGAFFLWLLFRSTDWRQVAQSIRMIDWTWFVLAQIPLFLSFPARVQRWTYIVRTTDEVSFRKLFSSTQIGFLANFILPGRAGEAIRALALTRLTKIRFAKSLAFVALDRVTDLFGLIAVIGISVLAFHPSEAVVISPDTFGTEDSIVFGTAQIEMGATLVGVLVAVVVSALLLVYFRREDVLRLTRATFGPISRRLADRVANLLELFADGLGVFRSPKEMGKSIAWSLVTWSLAMAAIALLLEAFAIDYRWYTPFVIQAILAVFITAPNTPGFVGQFHVPVVLGLVLTVPEIGSNTAKAFAIVYHLIQLPPIFLLGLACLLGERLNLVQLHSEGEGRAEVIDGEA